MLVTMAPSADVFRATTDSTGHYLITIRMALGSTCLPSAPWAGAPCTTPHACSGRHKPSSWTCRSRRRFRRWLRCVPRRDVYDRRGRWEQTPETMAPMAWIRRWGGCPVNCPPICWATLMRSAALIPGLTVTSTGATVFWRARRRQQQIDASMASPLMERTCRGEMRSSTRFTRRLRGIRPPWMLSGFQRSTILNSGQNVSGRTGHFSVDQPAVQFSDPVAARLGQEFTRLDVGEGGSGPHSWLDRLLLPPAAYMSRVRRLRARCPGLKPRPDALVSRRSIP